MQPIQNLQLGGRQSKAQLPVHPAERAGRRAERLGDAAAGADARRPDVPRRDQRLAAARPAGARSRSTATAPTRSACRSTTSARRCTAPSASARSSTIYTAGRQLPGDHGGGAPSAEQDESAFNNIYVRSSDRRAGAAVELRDRRAHGRADRRSTTSASCRRSRCRSTSRPARRWATRPRKIERYRDADPHAGVDHHAATAAMRRCSRARRAARRC